ncbi:fumarylacetoacetate hydrolase family protein [Gordonia sp. NPDC003376]
MNHAGTDQIVVATPDADAVVPLQALFDKAGLGQAPASMKQLLAGGAETWEQIRQAHAHIGEVATVALDTVTWLPPVPDAGKILGVAMNNVALNHTAHVDPAGPMFFLKPSSSLVGHGDNIEICDDYGFTFPELELGVIIGRRARNVGEDDALDHVAGYTVVNDITSQGLKVGDSIAVDVTREKADSPGYDEYFNWRRVNGPDDLAVYFTYHGRSKGADTFGPMGPWLVSRDEIADPDALTVRGYADGALFAEDSTASYSYSIRKIVSWASRYFTLEPGDVITCGTAAKGVPGFPRAHHEIDMSRMTPVVDIEIDGLGRLSNPVTHVARV